MQTVQVHPQIAKGFLEEMHLEAGFEAGTRCSCKRRGKPRTRGQSLLRQQGAFGEDRMVLSSTMSREAAKHRTSTEAK